MPEPHNESHLGGLGTTDDGLGAGALPTSIDIGDPGIIGTALGGFALWDHQHEAAGLDELLAFAFLGYR